MNICNEEKEQNNAVELFSKIDVNLNSHGNGINKKGYVILNDPAIMNYELLKYFYQFNRDDNIEVVTVGTTNEGKLDTVYETISELMHKLNINKKLCIIGIKVDSDVPDQPLNDQTLIGSRNRVNNLHFWAHDAGIRKGLLVGIEGGYEKNIFNEYYVFTAITLAEKNSWYQNSTRCSYYPITENIYYYVASGRDLNELIGKKKNIKNHNQKGGVTGFLSDDLYDRKDSDKVGLRSLLIAYFKRENMQVLDNWVSESDIFQRKLN